MPIVSVNYIAILISGIVSMALGFVWYGPLFGQQWIKLIGMSKKDIAKTKNSEMMMTFFLSFVGSLIAAFVLSHFILYAGVTTLTEGMMAGFWSWLGFIAPTFLMQYLYEKRSMNLLAINLGYHLVQLVLVGAILVFGM